MEWSGRTTLHQHKFNDWKNYTVSEQDKKALRKVNFLDVQWSTCPVEVEDQVKALWTLYELGNDHSIIKTSINELIDISEDYEENKTDAIIQYLEEQGITNEDEEIIIHWWW